MMNFDGTAEKIRMRFLETLQAVLNKMQKNPAENINIFPSRIFKDSEEELEAIIKFAIRISRINYFLRLDTHQIHNDCRLFYQHLSIAPLISPISAMPVFCLTVIVSHGSQLLTVQLWIGVWLPRIQ